MPYIIKICSVGFINLWNRMRNLRHRTQQLSSVHLEVYSGGAMRDNPPSLDQQKLWLPGGFLHEIHIDCFHVVFLFQSVETHFNKKNRFLYCSVKMKLS